MVYVTDSGNCRTSCSNTVYTHQFVWSAEGATSESLHLSCRHTSPNLHVHGFRWCPIGQMPFLCS